jgi:hypothetical protein
MFADVSGLDVTGLLVLGAGTALIGFALLVSGMLRRRRLALGVAALLLAGTGACGPLIPEFPAPAWPLFALAGVCAACVILSSSYPRRIVPVALALAAHPKVQGAALLLAGALLVVAWPWHLSRQASKVDGGQARLTPWDAPGAGPPAGATHRAWTDRGAPVTVYDVKHETAPTDEVSEEFLARSHDLALRLIRTAPPDRGTNCHGWLFTGGRYLVRGSEVERILADNGYQPVKEPRAGDVVVYRSNHGASIIHSAVVRSVTEDGLILLESKWTSLGRYLHRPEDYGTDADWTYYRSPRAGHLLRGIDADSPAGG